MKNPECDSDALIERRDFTVEDDAITINAGRNHDSGGRYNQRRLFDKATITGPVRLYTRLARKS